MGTLIPGERGEEIRIAVWDKDRLFIQTYDSHKQRTGTLVINADLFVTALANELLQGKASEAKRAPFDVEKACEHAKQNAR